MELFAGSISAVSETVSYTALDFYNFLNDNKIIQIGTAFIISNQINQLASKFIDNIVSPIIKRVFDGKADSLKETKIDIFGIQFEIGDFIMTILKFMINMIVLYYIFKILGKR